MSKRKGGWVKASFGKCPKDRRFFSNVFRETLTHKKWIIFFVEPSLKDMVKWIRGWLYWCIFCTGLEGLLLPGQPWCLKIILSSFQFAVCIFLLTEAVFIVPTAPHCTTDPLWGWPFGTPWCAVCNVQCAVCSVQFAACSMQCLV